MEWAKEKTQAAADTVRDTANNVLESGPVQQAEETAESAYETAADYIPGTEKSTTASIINTAPFSSFKPDPGNVWKGYVIYLSLALGCTLPWWAFVVAADYFNFRYHDHHMLRLFPLAYYAPWLLIYILFSAFGRQYTSWGRINLGLGISLVSLIAMPIIEGVFIKGQHGTTATFWVTLALVALAGAGDSIAQGSLVGIASELPERFTHAYVMGISVAGIIMFIVRVITKAAISSLSISAIVYFSIAPVFLVGVLGLFYYVHTQPAIGYYDSLGLGSMETVRLLVQDEATVTPEVAASAGIAAIAAGRSSPIQPLEYGPVISRLKLLAIAVGITALVSLLIFPGFLTEDLHSKRLGSWYPLLLVGTYSVFDFLGRLVTKNSVPERHSVLFGAAWARLIILLFFVLAIFAYGPTKVLMIIVLTALLGVTNGYLVSCLTIVIPRSTPANQAEPAGIIMATVMTLGTLIGAGLSWLWVLV